jgi:hypothetical protein
MDQDEDMVVLDQEIVQNQEDTFWDPFQNVYGTLDLDVEMLFPSNPTTLPCSLYVCACHQARDPFPSVPPIHQLLDV